MAKEKKPAAVTVDDQFIQDFVAKGGKAETPTGQRVDKENLDKFLNEVAGSNTAASTTPTQNDLHQEAVEKGMGDTTQEDDAAAIKEQARIDRQRQRDLKKQQGAALSAASKGINTLQQNAVNPVISGAGAVVDKIASLPTTGGVGLLLVILIFLLFVVVQVNAQGDTRLKQFWYMLNGRATLVGRVDVQKQDTSTQHQADQQNTQAFITGLESGLTFGLYHGGP